jgi:preprotein translocase subunit SecG
MYGILLIFHIIVCVALVLTVLLQSGKGGGLAGGAFGGTAQSVFGGRGATDFMTRATMVLGGLFFLTSLVLALMSSGQMGAGGRSLMQEEARRAPAAAPQVPGQAPGQAPTGTAPAKSPTTAPPQGQPTPTKPGGK